MKFLLDQNQSPLLVDLLMAAGHDAVHVRELGLAAAPDRQILAVAVAEQRTIISADMDFGELLSRSNAARPSVVLFRRQGQRRVNQIAALLLANLPAVIVTSRRVLSSCSTPIASESDSSPCSPTDPTEVNDVRREILDNRQRSITPNRRIGPIEASVPITRGINRWNASPIAGIIALRETSSRSR